MKSRVALAGGLFMLVVPASGNAQHSHGGGAPQRSEPRSEERPRPESEPMKPDRTIEIKITAEGFVPDRVTAKKGERVQLVITRGSDVASPSEFILDEFLVWRRLLRNETAREKFTTGRVGVFPFRSPDGTSSGVFEVTE